MKSVSGSQNIKLVLEYDGAPFYGFQRQPHHPTVQQALEEALAKLFNRKVKIKAASGRTDRGVHAEFQVVHFGVETLLDPVRILKGLNRYLPPAIAVKSVEKVSSDFHARYSAKSKTYEYRVWNHPVRSPLESAKSMHMPYPLDVSKMRRAARLLTGRHDFRAFRASDPSRREDRNSVRTVMRFKIIKKNSLLHLVIEADGFLYRMARNLVGTLLEVGAGRISLKELRLILKSRDRRKAAATAPAQGLFLTHVTY